MIGNLIDYPPFSPLGAELGVGPAAVGRADSAAKNTSGETVACERREYMPLRLVELSRSQLGKSQLGESHRIAICGEAGCTEFGRSLS